jgi:glycosyltransferase involved in cell wall biosynthesis
MQLSLILCTRNRADALERCLAAIPGDELQAADAELVLVDNGSTDRTPEVMERFRGEAGFPVICMREEKPGLSWARNAGLRAARGEMIAFTDDDCYLEPGYLESAVQLLGKDTFQFCGGRLLPYDLSDSPYGFNEDDQFRLFPPKSVIPAGVIQGANMIFQRRVVEAVGGFDTRLGAGTPFRCEDIEYAARASMAGFTGAYTPELAVRHHHGRKPGPEIKTLKRQNDVARGAYYSRLILMGNLRYLAHWAKMAFRRQKPSVTLREIRGALAFTASRIFHRDGSRDGDRRPETARAGKGGRT